MFNPLGQSVVIVFSSILYSRSERPGLAGELTKKRVSRKLKHSTGLTGYSEPSRVLPLLHDAWEAKYKSKGKKKEDFASPARCDCKRILRLSANSSGRRDNSSELLGLSTPTIRIIDPIAILASFLGFSLRLSATSLTCERNFRGLHGFLPSPFRLHADRNLFGAISLPPFFPPRAILPLSPERAFARSCVCIISMYIG